MKNRRNYYRILQVQPEAPTEVIKASYRTLMHRLKFHPDLGGNHDEAVLVNEAFATLIDPIRRAAYDRTLKRPLGQRSSPAPSRAAIGTSRSSPQPASDSVCGFCQAPCSIHDRKWSGSTCRLCGSTLFAPHTDPPAESSRRAIERVPRNMPITLVLSTSRAIVWPGTTEDVSLNGMRFLSPVKIPVGERLKIDCVFCTAVAVVRSIQPDHAGGWRCGAEFIALRIKQERGSFFSTRA